MSDVVSATGQLANLCLQSTLINQSRVFILTELCTARKRQKTTDGTEKLELPPKSGQRLDRYEAVTQAVPELR